MTAKNTTKTLLPCSLYTFPFFWGSFFFSFSLLVKAQSTYFRNKQRGASECSQVSRDSCQMWVLSVSLREGERMYARLPRSALLLVAGDCRTAGVLESNQSLFSGPWLPFSPQFSRYRQAGPVQIRQPRTFSVISQESPGIPSKRKKYAFFSRSQITYRLGEGNTTLIKTHQMYF